MLHQCAFHLKRADAVAGAFDDVIVPADKPIIPVLVLPGNVAGVIIGAAERLFRQLRIFIVAGKKSGRRIILNIGDDNFTLFAALGFCLFRCNQRKMIKRRRLSRRADFRLKPRKIRKQYGGFRLSESLIKPQPGAFFPAVIHFGIQRFSGGTAVLDTG